MLKRLIEKYLVASEDAILYNKDELPTYYLGWKNARLYTLKNIEQFRNALIEEVEKMKNVRILSIESSQRGKAKTEGYHKALKDIINLLKN